MMCEKYWISPIKPRDSARIDEILAVLSVVWKAQPDLRLGQLLCGLTIIVGAAAVGFSYFMLFVLHKLDQKKKVNEK